MSNNLNDVLDGLRSKYNGNGGDFEWSGNSNFLDPVSAEADALASIPPLAEWVLRHKGINIVRGDVDVGHATVNHWQEYHIPFDGTGTIPGPNTYLGYVAWLPHDKHVDKIQKPQAPSFFSVDGMLFSLKMQVEQLQLRVAALEGTKAPHEAKTRISATSSDGSSLKSTSLNYAQITALVAENNQSTTFSTELLACQIWKESSFNPNAVNGSHRGLMQISPDAVEYVNANTPQGVHFTHDEMFDPVRNIQCGTWYLRKRQEHEHTDVRETLNRFGTGAGYADNILTCEACVRANPRSPQPCLDAIHH